MWRCSASDGVHSVISSYARSRSVPSWLMRETLPRAPAPAGYAPSMNEGQLRVVPDVAEAVARDLAAAIAESARLRGRVVLCLAGGATPMPAYRALAERSDLPWGRVWIAWGDERNVAPDH